jgi:hypothetical protein
MWRFVISLNGHRKYRSQEILPELTAPLCGSPNRCESNFFLKCAPVFVNCGVTAGWESRLREHLHAVHVLTRRHMVYLDRSWDSGWLGIAAEKGRGDAFISDRHEGGELTGELEGPVVEKSTAYRIHRREDREASHGKMAGRNGSRASDDRKKDTRSARKEPDTSRTSRVDEDVDAVWHRGSRPRNF